MIHTTRILIVEDERPLRSALVQTLEDHNFEVTTASSGTEALKAYKKSKPDLILLDIILPEKSGFAVLSDLRLKLHSTTPVVILSNLDRPDDITTGKQLGATQYLLKSDTSLKHILEIIASTLAAAHPA